MLFASDLDQTLIYSYHGFGHTVQEEIHQIEEIGGRGISFIGAGTLARLKEVAAKYLFVPVTTRTIEQYQRLAIFQSEVVPQYVVTSNGGNILHNGRLDQNWAALVQTNIAQQCLPLSEVIRRFEEIKDPAWVHSARIADGLFYYCIIDQDAIPQAELLSFSAWVADQGWETYQQGRKLYLMPKPVNKKAAVLHLKQREGLSRIAAAGDSLLDLAMLQCADLAIAPRHGEIFRNYCDGAIPESNIKFTTVSGITSAEEILKLLIPAL